ncbi:MAG: ABC transporter permease, partial [Bacillota bacterium]|nr:ABC transporter permease [Bacillota bacterium]
MFSGGDINISKVLTSAALISAYYAFSIALLLLFSSLFKKSVFSGILVLIICYLLGTLNFVDKIKDFSPYVLISAANKFSFDGSLKGLTA